MRFTWPDDTMMHQTGAVFVCGFSEALRMESHDDVAVPKPCVVMAILLLSNFRQSVFSGEFSS